MQIAGTRLDFQLIVLGHPGIAAILTFPRGIDITVEPGIGHRPSSPTAGIYVACPLACSQQVHWDHRKLKRCTTLEEQHFETIWNSEYLPSHFNRIPMHLIKMISAMTHFNQ